MAERRKKTKAGDKNKGASRRKPRSRKAGAEPAPNEAVPAPAESRPEEQPLGDTPPLQDPVSTAPRAPLPGELYRKQDQWWWRVQLPGEDKATARPLQVGGEPAATDGQEAAEKIALALWEHAVEENATRRVKLESAEKIERLKAQFLDKVRQFTELVEATNAKLEAEQQARAQAEARLAQMIQAGGSVAQNAGQTGRGEKLPVMPSPAPARADTRVEPAASPAIFRPPTAPVPIPVAAPSAPGGVVVPAADPLPPLETGRCECCGATGIAMTHLTRIDSGQLLCPRCLAALRADATRST